MKRKILGRCLGTLALAAAALLIARLDAQAGPPEDNKEVSQLLEDIKGQAADLQRDSDELESFTRSDMSWQSHAEELDRIKERINAIGKTISKLQNLRSSASPWQQEAIDRIIPVAKKLASNTNCGDRAPEQKPAENQRAAVSAVPKIERRSRVEPRYISERLCGIWQDAHYIGSIRAQIGSAKIRLAALKSFLLNRMGDNAAHAS